MPFLFIYLVPPTPELVAILICRELKISIRQLEFMFNTDVDLKIAFFFNDDMVEGKMVTRRLK